MKTKNPKRNTKTTKVKQKGGIPLKPCPFCGSADVYLGQGGVGQPFQRRGAWGVDVFCRSCGAAARGAPLPKHFSHLDKKDYQALWPLLRKQAAEQWNRRTQ